MACPAKFSLNLTTLAIDASSGFTQHAYIVPDQAIRYFAVCMSWTQGMGHDFGNRPTKTDIELGPLQTVVKLDVAVQAVGAASLPRLFVAKTKYAATREDIRKANTCSGYTRIIPVSGLYWGYANGRNTAQSMAVAGT